MFVDENARIPLDGLILDAKIVLPTRASGVVVFACGSGRAKPDEHRVAQALQHAELGTVLFDLLTSEEERVERRTHDVRSDIALLAGRLAGIMDWLGDYSATAGAPLGLFGTGTGAAAALVAAAERPAAARAVVSHSGRPDLAGRALTRIQAPTLLIVSGEDAAVIEVNREAMEFMKATQRLEITSGATAVSSDPAALDEVARLAGDWFARNIGTTPAAPHTT